MTFKFLFTTLFIFLVLLFSSCSKGSQVRFSNYYIEKMDSVVIGNNEIIFTNILPQTNSDYADVKKGNYSVKCITKSKKIFSTNLSISKNSAKKQSIQMDGLNQLSVLED
jgi:hypothetical protein